MLNSNLNRSLQPSARSLRFVPRSSANVRFWSRGDSKTQIWSPVQRETRTLSASVTFEFYPLNSTAKLLHSEIDRPLNQDPLFNEDRDLERRNGYRPRDIEQRRFEPREDEPRAQEPRALGPRGLEPRGVEPKGFEPRGFEPKGLDPRGVEPRGIEPKGLEQRGYKPWDNEPRGFDPRGFEPRRYDGEQRYMQNQERPYALRDYNRKFAHEAFSPRFGPPPYWNPRFERFGRSITEFEDFDRDNKTLHWSEYGVDAVKIAEKLEENEKRFLNPCNFLQTIQDLIASNICCFILRTGCFILFFK